MAKERVTTYRNTGTETEPVWEKYYNKTVADAVMMTDEDNEDQNIKDYVDSKAESKADKSEILYSNQTPIVQ